MPIKRKVSFLLLALSVIVVFNCKKEGVASGVEGTYLFTITNTTWVHAPNNYSSSTSTQTYTGKVEKLKFREVRITFGNGWKIDRELNGDGSIVAQETCCEERGKFTRNSFTWHEYTVQLSHSFLTDVTAIKQ